MARKPLIANTWVRVVLFLVSLQLVYSLVAMLTEGGLELAAHEKPVMTNFKALWQNFGKRNYTIPLLVSIVAPLLTVFLFRRAIDKRSLTSLGLTFRNHTSSAGAGLFMGLLLLGTGTLILLAAGNLEWTDISFRPQQLFVDLGLMALIALAEELCFRGYVLSNLLPVSNKWIALILSALVFSLFHINNPGMNALPAINLFLAGLLLGVNYLYTQNLWFGILLHFIWNFYMGAILGYKVSGLQFQSLFHQSLTGAPWLTGGGFGFEGSAVATGLCLLAVAVLIFVYEKKTSPAAGTPKVKPATEDAVPV